MTTDALHTQLATTWQMLEFQQVDEARPLLKRLHKQYPKNPEVMLQLGLVERQMKQWPEAIVLLKKAVSLAANPSEHLRFTEYLAMTLMLSNQGAAMRQAIELYAEILTHKPDFEAVAINMSLLALRSDWPQMVLKSIVPLLSRPVLNPQVQMHYTASCALAFYLLGDFDTCAIYSTLAVTAYGESPEKPDPYYLLRYSLFLCFLLAFRRDNPALYAGDEIMPALHVIGESHCLSAAHTRVGENHRVVSHLIMGAKAYFLTYEGNVTWKYSLENIIRQIPKDEPIAVGFGELDCRPREGVMEQYRRAPTTYAIAQEIEILCAAYVKFVKISQLRRLGKTYIIGVPAPNRVAMVDLQSGEEATFTGIVREFNAALKREADKQQLGFVDLHAHTVGDDGWAKDGVHIDDVHLKPAVTAEALHVCV